jgi:Fic family protein
VIIDLIILVRVTQDIYGDIGDSYFDKDVDERKGNRRIEPQRLPKDIISKERNLLTIELSWKSSQIEGNTYSLLETEALLSEDIPAEGKQKDKAAMLLDHKTALDYIYEGRVVLSPLRTSAIEDIHSLLIADLAVSKNIRKRIVGITGTSYTSPENEFQIREYMERACEVINLRASVFEKALLAILFISYIQPFEDGNKRAGRITR